jgi:hypothetical protein
MASRSKPVVDEATQHVNRNLGVVAAVLAVGVTGMWAMRGQVDVVQDRNAALATTPHDRGPWITDNTPAERPARRVAAAAADAGASATQFQRYVAGKYRYLFKDATRAPQERAALRAALLERERVAVAINTARQSSDSTEQDALPARLAELAALDRKIGGLLPPAELAAFDVLKDSDIEQFQLDDYAGGSANVAPLSESDRQSILYTKLVYRQRFRQVLADSGLLRGDLSAAERKVVFADVSRALRDYQAGYLQEVRQYLYNDEQYTLLANYENSEYTAELAKLRSRAE